MLPLKVSWSGRAFALARCSDLPEKKSRRRRTKEERRTMVESFIKKYQNSNNGNFPSLNLTHKEVGGSFYTVREIVRDIIQENKVLRPGSLSSKAMSLEDCMEEYPVGFLSMDPHAIDGEQKKNYSLSSEYQITREENCEIVNSETPDSLASHPNGFSVSIVMHDKSSDHRDENLFDATYIDENLLDVDYEREDLRDPSGRTLDNSGTHECIYSKVQDHSSKDCNNHKVDQHALLHNSISITYPSSELEVSEYDLGNKSNNIAGTKNSFVESNDVSKITGQDISPETKTYLNSGNNNTSSPFQGSSASATSEVLRSGYTAEKVCYSDGRYVEAENFSSFMEVQQAHSFSNEVKATPMPVDKDPNMNRTEPTENLSSSAINEVIETRLTPAMSRTFESTKIEAQCMLQPSNTDSIVTNTGSPFPGSLSPEGDQTPSLNIVTNTGSPFPGSLSPEGDQTPKLTVKTKDEDTARKSNRGGIPCSTSEKTEESKEETNPIWAVVKAFVAAVIKFFKE